jgi:SAM-dependent methyltransferase
MSHSHNQQFSGKLSARILDAMEGLMDRVYGARKRAIWRELPDTVVEIGAGAGANLRYYKPGTRVIAYEPDAAMGAKLATNARQRGIDLDLRPLPAEAIDLPSGTVSAVVGTLVLCTVGDPRQVVSQVQRILTPGGRYIFLEHVAAAPRTPLRTVQELLRYPWQWVFDGCHLNRDTHRLIQDAGFGRIDMDCFEIRASLLPFAPHIFGVAIK